MPSPLRYIPEEAKLWTDDQGRKYAIVEITVRCHQGRFLLTPTQKKTSLILGVLGRAQAKLDFLLFGYVFLSNHGSYLAGVRSVEHQASIMDIVHGNMARELGRSEHSDWPGKFWERRGRPILVSSDEDLEERLKYLLSNSTKEHLVERPIRWPGAHCAKALCEGTTDKGLWINRTELSRLSRLKNADKPLSQGSAETHYSIEVERIPSHASKTAQEYREYIKALCADIAREAAQEREESGVSVVGVNAILAQEPHYRPENLSRSPAPAVHCRDKKARTSLLRRLQRLRGGLSCGVCGAATGDRGLRLPQRGHAPRMPLLSRTACRHRIAAAQRSNNRTERVSPSFVSGRAHVRRLALAAAPRSTIGPDPAVGLLLLSANAPFVLEPVRPGVALQRSAGAVSEYRMRPGVRNIAELRSQKPQTVRFDAELGLGCALWAAGSAVFAGVWHYPGTGVLCLVPSALIPQVCESPAAMAMKVSAGGGIGEDSGAAASHAPARALTMPMPPWPRRRDTAWKR